MWCGSIASSGTRSSLRTAADSLTDGVGEDRAERRSRDEQCRDRPLVDHVDQHDPDDTADTQRPKCGSDSAGPPGDSGEQHDPGATADTQRPKCVSDSAEPSLRTAVMLSEGPETLRACCHSDGYFTP